LIPKEALACKRKIRIIHQLLKNLWKDSTAQIKKGSIILKQQENQTLIKKQP
jgi:hypothetical protein